MFLCSTVVTKPSLACYAQEVVVEIGDNERGRFKIRWIWEDFPPQNIKAQLLAHTCPSGEKTMLYG